MNALKINPSHHISLPLPFTPDLSLSQTLFSIVTLIPSGLPSWILTCTELKGYWLFTARCTLVQSAVLRSHVICLFFYGSNKSKMAAAAMLELFEQIQDGGRRHVGKISNGHISATGRPIHFMFGYRVGFSETADLMALSLIRTNSRWQPLPSWIISNGHIYTTAHDLLI